MDAIEKMQIVLHEDYGIYVTKEEITAEGVLLYADEIDETLVPIEMLVSVTEPIQTEMTSYRDTQRPHVSTTNFLVLERTGSVSQQYLNRKIKEATKSILYKDGKKFIGIRSSNYYKAGKLATGD